MSEVERPKPSADHNSRDLGDEMLFYDRAGDRVHVLNGVAREIFLLCDGERTTEQIANEIVSRYEVDFETAHADVRKTVEQLHELGLVSSS
jgi:hypothetical protein